MRCAKLKGGEMASYSAEINYFQRLLRVVSKDGHRRVLIASERVLFWGSHEEPAYDKNRSIFCNDAMDESRHGYGAAVLAEKYLTIPRFIRPTGGIVNAIPFARGPHPTCRVLEKIQDLRVCDNI